MLSIYRMWSGDWILGQSSVLSMVVSTSQWPQGNLFSMPIFTFTFYQLSVLTCWIRFFLSSHLRFRSVCHKLLPLTTSSLPRHSSLGLPQPCFTPPGKVTPSYKLSVKLLPVWRGDAFACWDTPFSGTLRPSSQVEESLPLNSWWSNQLDSCVRHP